MLVQFGTNCFHICNKILEQSVPYVMLNRYVLGCTSYDTNMYHIMIGICHISSTENYVWLCFIIVEMASTYPAGFQVHRCGQIPLGHVDDVHYS